MKEIRATVYGKINLSLNVEGVRGNMHLLDGIFASVSLFDSVNVKLRSDDKVYVHFDCDVPEKNTAVDAAMHFARLGCGAEIDIKKGLPMCGGMGGSSADGAAVLAALNALTGKFTKTELQKIAISIGSDVPYMLDGGFCRVRGIGEDLTWINCPTTFYVVLLSDISLSTAEVFAEYDKLSSFYGRIDNNQAEERLKKGLMPDLGNMLTLPATNLRPQIIKAFDILRVSGGKNVNMTGSGGSVYALTESKEDAERIASHIEGARVIKTLQKGLVLEAEND